MTLPEAVSAWLRDAFPAGGLDVYGFGWFKPQKADLAKYLYELDPSNPKTDLKTHQNRLSNEKYLPVQDRPRRVWLQLLDEAVDNLTRSARDAGHTSAPDPPAFCKAYGTRDVASPDTSQLLLAPQAQQLPQHESKVLRSTWHSASLDDWQESFASVYAEADIKLTLYDMMLQMIVDATRLSEAIRGGKYGDVRPWFARVFSWLFSIATRAQTSDDYRDLCPSCGHLSDIVWHRYPRRCCLCGERNCLCPTKHPPDELTGPRRAELDEDPELKAKLEEARRVETRPESLDDWFEMFDEIYKNVNRSRPASAKMLHLWEEIGELEIEVRLADKKRAADRGELELSEEENRKLNWEAELADVVSWLSSIYLHVDGFFETAHNAIARFESDRAMPSDDVQTAYKKRPAAEWLWIEYGPRSRYEDGLHCHRCEKSPCTCTLKYERR